MGGARVCIAWPAAARITRPALFGVLGGGSDFADASGLFAGTQLSSQDERCLVEYVKVLRQQSPPNAIVNTWWDYGYWAKYAAERRVNNDGGSLRTHIPYWTARVLAAPSERESAGLLRMLDCGSDATPEAEGPCGCLRTNCCRTEWTSLKLS